MPLTTTKEFPPDDTLLAAGPTEPSSPPADQESLDWAALPLEEIWTQAFDAVLVVDRRQRIVRFNQGAEQLFGYTFAQALGQPVAVFLRLAPDGWQNPSLSHSYRQSVSGHHKDGSGFTADAWLATPQQPDPPFTAVFLRLDAARQMSTSPAQADCAELEQRVQQHTAELEAANARLQQEIAERWRAEEELRKTVRAVEQSPVSIVITDLEARIEYVNPKFVAITGYSTQEVLGQNPRILKSGETSVEDYRQMWDAISAGQEWRGEFHNRKKNGELYWELASISPIRNQNNTITHYLGVKEDITERKRAEESLRLNEVRLEALLRFSSMTAAAEKEIIDLALEEGVRLTNSTIGYLHFINEDQISLELFTWSQEVYKHCYAEKTKHYPLEQAGVWVDCVRQRRPVIHNDYQHVPDRKGYPEGHIHIVRHLSVPLIDGDRVVAVAGVGNKAEPYDETDARQLSLFMSAMWGLLQRKRAELALQQLNAELEQRVKQRTAEVQDLYNNAPCGYHSLDPDGVIIHINDTELRWLGYQRDELAGCKHFVELLTAESGRQFQQRHLLLQQHGYVKDLELTIVRKDSATFPVLLNETTVRDEAGHYVMSRSTVFNISELKQAEAAWRHSEERFRRYFELSLVGMAVTSPERGWLEVNDRLCEILGYFPEELTHLSWADVTHPADVEASMACFSRMLAGEIDGCALDKRFIRKDGQSIEVSISLKCLRRPDGGVECFLALVQDITASKRAEHALRLSRDELSAANASLAKAARLKDEFLASMSHELRTPLTGILNLSEALQEQIYGRLNERQLNYLHTIEENGRHLLELINDILDLSRIEAGQLELHAEKCSAAEVCQSSLQLIKGMAHKKRQRDIFHHRSGNYRAACRCAPFEADVVQSAWQCRQIHA